MKGYYTGYAYMGWTGKSYRAFSSEEEYREWYEENVYDPDYLQGKEVNKWEHPTEIERKQTL